ncbi:hypothetical protein XAC3810_750067 [Xanthomonas citri pv. citri]|nr:hypothetical protein XAC908_1060072 [Xanthomonas citri pv. citri]CEE47546.1 hypothetical protein XAC3810_750067 [Xanthomonas citri pv. citri]
MPRRVAPSRARGLKRHHALNALTHGEVAPSRARGLKRGYVIRPFYDFQVAPSRARGLKLRWHRWMEPCASSRPHGRVD